MKIRLITTALAAVLLTSGITAQAASPKMSQTEMTEMCKSMDSDDCRMMMREMVKRKDLHKPMAEELMKSPEFTQSWQELHKHQSAHGG